MQEFLSEIERYTTQMQAANAGSGSATQKRELARGIAMELTKLADAWDTELPGLRSAWEQFADSSNKIAELTPIKSLADRESAEALLPSLSSLEQQMQEAIDSVMQLKGMVDPLRGISRDMNQALRRFDKSLGEIASTFEIGASTAVRVTSILQERLEVAEN